MGQIPLALQKQEEKKCGPLGKSESPGGQSPNRIESSPRSGSSRTCKEPHLVEEMVEEVRAKVGGIGQVACDHAKGLPGHCGQRGMLEGLETTAFFFIRTVP